MAHEHMTIAFTCHEIWRSTRTTKSLFFFFKERKRRLKRISKLKGESHRPINQPVMKICFLMGRKQKANCAGLRACPTILKPLPAPAGIFMGRGKKVIRARERLMTV